MIRFVALLLAVPLVAGCGGAGSTGGSGPAGSAGRASQPASASGSPTEEAPVPSTTFALTSTQFADGGDIPVAFTCDAEDRSPDLAWTGAPDGTAALVLVVDDPDASGFVHWIAYDLTGTESGALPLGISTSPDAPPQGTNDFSQVGWGGPCPPSGEHRYRFTLTALAEPLGLIGAPRAQEIRDALGAATVLGTATLEARYRRR